MSEKNCILLLSCEEVDSKLKFNDHVYDMCTEAGRQLNVLQRLKSSLDYDSRIW